MTISNPVPETDSDDTQAFRLSFAQERIWFLEQLNPGTPVFTISTALRATGPLDLAALEAALAELSERHETLRTRFMPGEGGPVQEVLSHAPIAVEILDRRGEDIAEADLEAVIRRSVNVTFDLSVAPLMKVGLVRLRDDDAVLTICAHHIICDGPSAEILWRDLTELYLATAYGTQPRLPELQVQYADYAEWQRNTIDEQVLGQQLDFWRDELRGTTGRCPLPLDRPRPPAQDSRGAMMVRALPASRAAALLEVCRTEHVSPFMLVLAAYELALTRSSGRADFCVGTSIAGRTQRDVEEVLGCFINLMPVRSDTPGNPTLYDLLHRVRQRCLRAYANADLPFERLVEELAPERDLSRAPLFDVLLTVQNGRSTAVPIGELTLTPQLVATSVARYDLALDVEVDEGGMTLVLCYATSVFDASTVRLLTERIDDALAAFEGDLGRRLSAVPIRAGNQAAPQADPPARGQAVTPRNGPPRHLGGAAASATAAHLAAHGVGPGSVVAVAVASPLAQLAAVLGTMRTGAAALLLDPADPRPWRDRQLASIGASAALTDALYTCTDGVVHWAGSAPDRAASLAPADPSAPALLIPVPGRGNFDAWVLAGSDLAVIARGLAARCALGADDRVLISPGGGPGFAVVGALTAELAGAEVVTADPTVVLRPHGGGDGPADGGHPAAGEAPSDGSAVCVYAVLCAPESGLPYAAGGVGEPPRVLSGAVSFVRDDTGALALPGATGQLMLSGAAPVLRSGQVGTGFLARVVPGRAPAASARADGLPLVTGRVVDPVWASDCLAALPELRDVAVIHGPDGPIAFVAPSDLSVDAIGDRLRRELPVHLVPARIIALPRLPRGRDGGPDTVALAALAARAEPGAASTPRTHVERALLDCFMQSLARGDLGIYDDFFTSGGTSLAAARLTSALSDAVGIPVPLKLLFQYPTVAELAAALDSDRLRAGRSTALEDALSDQVLPPDIRPAGRPRDRLETVFLTGATGFVGSQLLAQLLSAGMRRVWCLVRGEDERACRDRLLATLARYSLDVDADRIGVLRGDLAKPLLDLGEARFAELADEADVIFHLGAHMNFVRPYRVLHGPNVHGTQEILRLACAGRPSELHYVSTIDSLIADRIPEQPIPVDTGKDDGYVLTKKTAERLVLQAGERGLPMGIYRPWQITSDSRTGAVNPNDQLALCLTGILLTGIAPSDNPLPLRILPVETVAKALADMIGRLDPKRPIHHFYNTRTTPIEVVAQVVAECGYQVRVVPYRQWRVEVIRRTANKVAGLSALLARDVSTATLPSVVETANLRARLGYAPAWPSDDHRWVRTTIEYLVRRGVVEPAEASPNGRSGRVSA